MRGTDDEDAARRGTSGRRPRRRRMARDTGELAARLAPTAEREPALTGRNGAGPDDSVRGEAENLMSADGLPDEEEDEHGVLYMAPVVKVAVSLFLEEVEVVALGRGALDGVGHAAGGGDFVVLQDERKQFAGVGVVVNAEDMFISRGDTRPSSQQTTLRVPHVMCVLYCALMGGIASRTRRVRASGGTRWAESSPVGQKGSVRQSQSDVFGLVSSRRFRASLYILFRYNFISLIWLGMAS